MSLGCFCSNKKRENLTQGKCFIVLENDGQIWIAIELIGGVIAGRVLGDTVNLKLPNYRKKKI